MEQLKPTFAKKTKLTLLRNVGSLFILLLLPHVFYGTTYYLTTAGAGSAHTPGNWNTGGIGGGGTAATTFTSSTADTFIIATGATAATFSSNAGNTVITFGNGTNNTVLIVNSGSTISLSSKNTLAIASGSSIILKGTSATQISGSGTTGNIAGFNLTAGSTIFTENTNGILGTNCSIVSSANFTISLDTAANYTFSGNTTSPNTQSTTGLPSTVNNLTFSGTGPKTLASNVKVNGTYSIENGSSVNVYNGALSYGTSATLRYNSASSRNVGVEWVTPFSATGGVIIAGTGTVTLNGAKQLGNSTNVPLTINSGATLATANNALTFHGNFVNNGTLTAGSSDITIAGTQSAQSIGKFTTTGILSLTKTSGTATLNGAVSAGTLTINGSGGTLNLGSGSFTHTISGSWNMTAGTLNGGNAILKFTSTGATILATSGATFAAGTGTVEYAGLSGSTNQIIPAYTYNNLTISGSGNNSKIAAADFIINGVLNLSSSNYSASQGCLHMTNGASEYVLSLGNNSATVSGKGDVTGIVSRAISVTSVNTALSFNNVNTTINLRSYTTLPGGIQVKLRLDNPGNITGASSVFNISDLIDKKVKRYYQIIYTGTAPSNVVTDIRLAFQDAERETLIPSSSSLIDFWDCHDNNGTFSTHSHGHTSDFADAGNSVYYVQLDNKDLIYVAPTSAFTGTIKKYWYLALSNATANAVFWSGVGSNGGWDKAISNTSDLVIPSGLSSYPTLGANLDVNSISIASGASLDGGGKVITIGASTASGVIAGWMNSGTYTAGTSGKVKFTGNNVAVGGNNTFNDLEFTGASPQIVSGSNNTTTVKGTLIFTGSGSLITNGNLVIGSDINGTGRIDGNVSGKIDGSFAVQRYLPATGRRYRFLAVPVVDANAGNWRSGGSGFGIQITGSGGTSNGFDNSTTNAPSAFWYDETIAGNTPNTTGPGAANDAGWTAFTSGTQSLTNGRGYRVLVRGDRTISLTTPGAVPAANITTISASGTYPSSPVVINVTKTGTNDNSGYNLVGNPFPSSISWAQISKTNVEDSYYMYTPSSGTYSSWNGTTGTNGLTDIISSSQGFFVRATSATGSLSISESAKSTGQGSVRFKKSLNNHLRLTLTYDSLNSDEQVIHFRENASLNYDNGYDAYHLSNSSINFSSLDANGVKYSINSLPPLSESTEVPLSLEGTTKATYTLKISDRNTFAGHQVFLKDKLLNTITEITSDVQTIAVVHDAASELKAANRFSVVFTKNASGMNEVSLEEGVELYPNPVKNDCYLVWKGMRQEPCTYSIYDEAGRTISEGSLDFGQQRTQKLDMTSFQNGIYFIAIHTSGNRQVIRFVK